MNRNTQTQPVQHPILHAIHEAVHHLFHHAHHHGIVHHARPAIVRHAHEGSEVEDLEGRMMLSATGHSEASLLVGQSVATVTVGTATTTTTTKTAATTTTTTTKTKVVIPGPVAVADPATTDKALSYKSFANDPLFGPGGPTITDINQGELGDCYLMSVLSTVAKSDAKLIRQLITQNTNGTYTVTFAGKKTVTVDADLAVMSNGQPAYAQLGTGNSLWVALTEKAYADYVNPKTNSYATIDGGWMGSAFTALGLTSTSTFSTASAAALATVVQKDLKAADFVTMGTASYVGKNSPLVAGHAYEIDSVTVSKKGVITAITLRNPWGNSVTNDGYVTVTPQQAFNAFAGLAISHA